MMMVLITSIHYFFRFLYVMILIRCILSWIPGIHRYRGLIGFVDAVTEPILRPIRDLTFRYLNLGMFDISPIIAIFLLQFIERMVLNLLFMVYR